MGDDKSGSALSGVLSDMLRVLSDAEADAFYKQVYRPLLEAIENGEQEIQIDANSVSALVGPLGRYHAELDKELGHPIPCEAPEIDRQRGMDMTRAKWGDGLGWQFYCTNDLLRACEISRMTGEPITLSFD
jgi:hypothetical protein